MKQFESHCPNCERDTFFNVIIENEFECCVCLGIFNRSQIIVPEEVK